MGERRRVALILFCWLGFLVEGGWAVEPGRFAISQVAGNPPNLIVYLDVVDENGEPLVRLPPSQLSASIQGQPVKVSQVSTFDASGEGVAYIFLVDVSKSIGSPQFVEMRQAIDEWIDGLKSVDRMAIFTFGSQYKQLAGFTADKARLKVALQSLRPTDSQTKLYLALNNAINLSRQTTEGLPNRRVIVILSDGKDEGSGITVEDVRDLIPQGHTPIYAIGYSRLPVRDREHYLQVLNRLATLSGGLYSTAATVKAAYEETESTIRRLFVIRLNCESCTSDAQLHPLEMTLKSNDVTRTSSLGVNLFSSPPSSAQAQKETPNNPEPSEPWWKVVLSWKVLLSFGLVIGVGVGVVFHVELKGWLWPPPPVIVDPYRPVISEPRLTPDPVSISPGRSIQLTVVAGKEHGRSYHFNLVSKSVIGRDVDCDVSFPEDTEMSGRHFQLALDGNYVEVADLGSTNGTLLNGAPLVTGHRLVDGDMVRAGRTEVRININGVT